MMILMLRTPTWSELSRRALSAARRAAHTQPEPDLPEDPDRDDDLPDVNPGSNPDNPGDQPHVREPGVPPDIKA
jgi:hypothetical protein